jgi:membrane-associated phospholipid phosphatase
VNRVAGAGCLCFVLACLTCAKQAHADEPKQTGALVWQEKWPKFRPSEYVITAAAGIASVSAYFLLTPPSKPYWTGRNFLDDDIRDELRVRSPTARENVRSASNVVAVAAVVWAVGVDSLLVPALRHKPDIAIQLALMDAESFALSTMVTTTMFSTLGRARPSYADCQRDPNFDRLCRSATTSSFPSGHTNGSFTAAGLSCAHHLHLGLYGDPTADALACVGTITVASGTGVLRVMGDRHYATDVWAGGLIGFAFGYGMPTLFHYGKVGSATEGSLFVSPVGSGFPFGPTISGTF